MQECNKPCNDAKQNIKSLVFRGKNTKEYKVYWHINCFNLYGEWSFEVLGVNDNERKCRVRKDT